MLTLLSSSTVFLIITELPIMTCYVARNWPLLSPSSGFVTLGVLMVFTGTSILGNLNKEATSEQSLGLSFWQIVIASGILTLILGVINIIAVSIRFRSRLISFCAIIPDVFPFCLFLFISFAFLYFSSILFSPHLPR